MGTYNMWNLLLPVLSSVLDRVIPNTEKRREAMEELTKMQFNGEMQLLLKQIETNQGEAQSTRLFVSGWRPFVGWICALTFALTAITKIFLPTFIILYAAIFDIQALKLKLLLTQLSAIDTDYFTTILFGLLGLGFGGLRSFEKLKGLTK